MCACACPSLSTVKGRQQQLWQAARPHTHQGLTHMEAHSSSENLDSSKDFFQRSGCREKKPLLIIVVQISSGHPGIWLMTHGCLALKEDFTARSGGWTGSWHLHKSSTYTSLWFLIWFYFFPISLSISFQFVMLKNLQCVCINPAPFRPQPISRNMEEGSIRFELERQACQSLRKGGMPALSCLFQHHIFHKCVVVLDWGVLLSVRSLLD